MNKSNERCARTFYWKLQNSPKKIYKRLKQMEGYTMLMNQRLNIVKVSSGPKLFYSLNKTHLNSSTFCVCVEIDKLFPKRCMEMQKVSFCWSHLVNRIWDNPGQLSQAHGKQLCTFRPDHSYRQGPAQHSNPFFLPIRAESLPISRHWDFLVVSQTHHSTLFCKGDAFRLFQVALERPLIGMSLTLKCSGHWHLLSQDHR